MTDASWFSKRLSCRFLVMPIKMKSTALAGTHKRQQTIVRPGLTERVLRSSFVSADEQGRGGGGPEGGGGGDGMGGERRGMKKGLLGQAKGQGHVPLSAVTELCSHSHV